MAISDYDENYYNLEIVFKNRKNLRKVINKLYLSPTMLSEDINFSIAYSKKEGKMKIFLLLTALCAVFYFLKNKGLVIYN